MVLGRLRWRGLEKWFRCPDVSSSRLVPGIDVPWVTRWSEEPLGLVQPLPELGGRLGITQVERPGHGRPIYSENHLPRQRFSALGGLCPMCGAATEPGERWSLTGKRVTAGELRARGVGRLLPQALADRQPMLDGGAIAPLHKSCATRSAKDCPHLRSGEATELTPFPEQIILLPLTIEARPPPGGSVFAQPLRSTPVITFIQVVGVFRT